MQTLDLASIKKRSLTGIVTLTSRTFILQIIAFAATFLLTIFLSPATFGIFYVVSAIISFLTYFSDIGLAAALIQKKEELTSDDLATTFTIQQLLVFTVVVFALLSSQAIAVFYRLDTQGLWLFRALVVSLFLSSLKTIPSVILERKLDFQTLVIPQILETIAFYTVAVILAWQGWGIVSFTWAVLARAVVGVVSIYLLAPWKLSLGLSKLVAGKLLRFGLPFQINSLLALVKDDLMTVFLGKVLPFSEVGYLGWAKKWAEVPLRLFMDSVVRVTFPAFARLQHAKISLGKAIEKTLFGLSSVIFPISVGLLFFMEPLVKLIPRYVKWEPALFSFYLLAIGSAVSSLSVPLTNTLNAIGRIKVTLILMVMWTTLTWILTIILVKLLGFQGFAWAILVITGTIILVAWIVKRFVPFAFLPNIKYPLIGAVLQGGWYWVLRGNPPYAWPRLISVAAGGVILYLACLWLTEKSRIRGILSELIKTKIK